MPAMAPFGALSFPRLTPPNVTTTYVFNPINKKFNFSGIGRLSRCHKALGFEGRGRLRFRRRRRRGFECLGSVSVGEVGNAALAVEWPAAADQLMLVTSVALAYLAGIVTPPAKKRVVVVQPDEGAAEQCEREPESNDLRAAVAEEAQEAVDPWAAAQTKLGAALSKLSRKGSDVGFYDRAVRNPVLSLQALGAGSRLRLLVRALEHLHTQVDLIHESSKSLPSAEWSKLTLDALCGSVEPICTTWLAQEPSLVEEKSSTTRSSQGRTLVLDYLQRTGKTELYMDLLFFLRFQTMRPGACCDYAVMSRQVGDALEDLVVALADGAAAIYLGRDSQIGGREDDWPVLVRPSIKSTRSLERFRNEIALQSWFQRNYTSVVSMFEDRFELWTIERRPGDNNQQLSKEDDPSVDDLKLKRMELPARRGKELRALTGWRYFYSLYLEFSDIVGPLLQILVMKAGEAVSFLLVRLIGRALGLIFEGIRQSVRWSPSK